MTSSSTIIAHKQAKVLTDFSIETIIGVQTENNKSIKVNRPSYKDPTSARPATTTNDYQQAQVTIASNLNTRKYRPKNFQCPACKMAFSNNGQLKNHVRIHTGERPFRCNQPGCNKTFTRNEELTRHKLIHTGVRPHSCHACGKRFGRKDHLKKHVRTHDRKKLRKKVFVPSPRCSYIKEDVFGPASKLARLNHQPDTNNLIHFAPPVTCSASHSNFANQLLPPATSSVPEHQPPHLLISPMDYYSHLYHPLAVATSATTTTSTTIASTTATTSLAIQQLAKEYWNKWYNLLG